MELLDMTRQGMSHNEECVVGPGPEDLSSPESEPKSLSSLSLQQHLCLVGAGGGGSGLLLPCSRKGWRWYSSATSSLLVLMEMIVMRKYIHVEGRDREAVIVA
jgi:hypothetical protein